MEILNANIVVWLIIYVELYKVVIIKNKFN